ncbi:Ank2 [Symbiodinium sp. CCMP2592]|nr:Ank2 [Symbiodinium sp. CCMP2592]
MSDAAASGHTDAVELLLFANPRPGLNSLSTSLHAASERGFVDVVRLLLRARAGADTLICGETALSKSAGKGRVEVVSLLLEARADTEKGSPLCSACASGVAQAVRMLLGAGADTRTRAADGPPVYIAADRGYIDILKLVLEARANANDTSREDTPLYRASFRGYAVTVRLLLEAMATVDTLVHGKTPLEAASGRGHCKTVRLLLNAKADKDTSSALCSAIRNEQAEVVSELLTARANTDDTATGDTPLGLAAGRGMSAMVRMLLQARADINKVAEGAEAPLCKACAGGHIDVARSLLEAGADRNLGSPLCSACDDGHTEIVQLLLTARADKDACNIDGRTPLWLASSLNFPDVVRLLLSAGADPNFVVLAGSYGRHVALGGLDCSGPTWKLLMEAWISGSCRNSGKPRFSTMLGKKYVSRTKWNPRKSGSQ